MQYLAECIGRLILSSSSILCCTALIEAKMFVPQRLKLCEYSNTFVSIIGAFVR